MNFFSTRRGTIQNYGVILFVLNLSFLIGYEILSILLEYTITIFKRFHFRLEQLVSKNQVMPTYYL